MATFKLSHDFGEDLGKKVHNMNTDTFYLLLSNTSITQSTVSVYGDITQIAGGNGYTVFTGAETAHNLDTVSYAETTGGSGVWRWNSSVDEVFTAAGGSIATFRYIAVVNNTDAAGSVVGHLDYGSAVDVTVGNTFTVDVGANGWFELTIPA